MNERLLSGWEKWVSGWLMGDWRVMLMVAGASRVSERVAEGWVV